MSRWQPKYPNRYARRAPSKRPLTVGAANKKFQRKHTNCVILYNTPCQVQHAVFSDTCPNGGAIQLLTQASLFGAYGDSITITRLKGTFYFQPEVMPGANPIATVLLNSTAGIYMRVGLAKQKTTQRDGFIARAIEPLSGLQPGQPRGDWSEHPWWRLWEHYWTPTATGSLSEPNGCCPDITGDFSPPLIADGTTVPLTGTDLHISSTCNPCNPEGVIGGAGGTVQKPPWKISLDIRRPFTLHDDDDLSLWFGWENVMAPAEVVRRTQPNMMTFGGCRAWVEQ